MKHETELVLAAGVAALGGFFQPLRGPDVVVRKAVAVVVSGADVALRFRLAALRRQRHEA
jgi:hypothetical protein